MKRDADSSQWCPMKGKESMAQISKKKLLNSEGGQTLDRLAREVVQSPSLEVFKT